MHFNTVLIPVAWEQIEPVEGTFDFTIQDHWIDVAREQHLHLVLLWFGSWKNGFSSYAPAWVKTDAKRFPRAVSADGTELEILSTLGTGTLKSDSRAFAARLKHVREKDQVEQTVLMVQVEMKSATWGGGVIDRQPPINCFKAPPPQSSSRNSRPIATRFLRSFVRTSTQAGHSWQGVFGEQAVAAAGKQAYPLPMYVNAQLPAPAERAGEYPNGGPHPYYLEVYRIAAPSLDFYAPDIYWPNFAYWIERYRFTGDAVFVPEARIESALYNAFYAYREAKAFGFSPFGVDSLVDAPSNGSGPGISEVYAVLDGMRDMLVSAQAENRTRGVVLHSNSPRPTQTVSLGGYLFGATLSRSWPTRALLADDGGMLIVQSAANEFFIAGAGLSASFFRDPDVNNKLSGISSIEEVEHVDGK